MGKPLNNSMMLEGKERVGLLSVLLLFLVERRTEISISPGVSGTGIKSQGSRAQHWNKALDPLHRSSLRIGKKRLISGSALFPKKGIFFLV